MSLYGALFSGVSGLKSQANKLGVISDNVSNVNTVGYKGGNGLFETLVTTSGGTAAYSPGGVIGGSRLLVSRQGLLQATDSATDIAISGNGFFVVNQNSTGAGQVFYTRSGSFRADATGNFRNSSGFYLQAWPLDREGRLPGAAGNTTYTTSSANLQSLQVVNIQNLTGSAAATTSVQIGANLNATQSIFAGAGGTITMDSFSTNNYGIAAKDILIPGGPNGISRGDKMVISTGNGLNYSYRYGGFTFSRDITDASGPDSGATQLANTTTLGTNPFSFTAGSNVVTVTQTAHGLADGAVISLSGNTSNMAGISASEFNGTFVVDVIDANTYTINVSSSAQAAITVSNNTMFSDDVGPGGTATIRVPVGASHGFSVGQDVTIASATGFDNILASELNGTQTITAVGANYIEFQTVVAGDPAGAVLGGGTPTVTLAAAGGASIVSTTRPFSGRILDATNAETRFLATTGTSGFTTAGLSFKVTTAATGTVTFNYTSGSADTRQKQFNNLNTLASAINNVTGLTARVVNNRLYVGATDANAAVTFENGSTVGTSGPPVQAGIDWVTELGLADITAGSNRFSSMQGLANLATADAGISATITNPLGSSTLKINVDDPLDTITFEDSPTAAALTALAANSITTTSGSDIITVTHSSPHGMVAGDFVELDASAFGAGPFNGIPVGDFTGRFEILSATGTSYTIRVADAATSTGTTGDAGLIVTPHNNLGSIVSELGLADSLQGGAYTPQASSDYGPAYSPTDTTLNMASGSVLSQFSRPIRIYDAQGGGHDLNVAFLKTNVNTWAIEVFAVPESDVSSSLPDGLVAYGNVVFNGDGTLNQVDTTLTDAVDITWTNGSSASNITFNWGTVGPQFDPNNPSAAGPFGESDGLGQYSSAYKVNFANQNGAPVGELSGVQITEEGVIVASYSNGQTQQLYRIPLADFANPDQLTSQSGNVFLQSADSGEFNLRQAGTSGVGKIAASSLEASNVELSSELTDMIIAQRSYQANAKVISTSDNMLEELNRIIT